MAEIEAIAEDSQISIEKMAMILNSSRRTVARDISWLIDNGYIIREGHTKGSRLLVLRNICEYNQE